MNPPGTAADMTKPANRGHSARRRSELERLLDLTVLEPTHPELGTIRRGEHADDAGWRSSVPGLQPRCAATVPRTGRGGYAAPPSEWLIISVMLTDSFPTRLGVAAAVVERSRNVSGCAASCQ
jgi:hypothetical protein